MKGTLSKFPCGGRNLRVYTPPGYGEGSACFPAVYAGDNGMEDAALDAVLTAFERRTETGECRDCVFIAIPPENWEEEYSPWPAPPAFLKSNAFPGGGRAYLRFLTDTVKPSLEAAFRLRPAEAALMGYSLGGLHALWSAYVCGDFQGYASLSGSLWYDGWGAFAASHAPVDASARIYLSLGLSEEKGRNSRLRTVGDRTRETLRLLEGQLASPENVTLEWNPGGHFSAVPERFCAALCWLLKSGK